MKDFLDTWTPLSAFVVWWGFFCDTVWRYPFWYGRWRLQKEHKNKTNTCWYSSRKKKSNKTGLKLEIGTELHSVAETGTELKPSKPHNAAGPVLWFLTSGSTLSHWIDIFMDHLGSALLHECKLPWISSPESTLLCNEYTWYCCYLSSVLYSLRGKAGSLFSPTAQYAQLAISVLLFSKVQWKQQTTVLLYCNALYCIPFPSAEGKLILRTADMTLVSQ